MHNKKKHEKPEMEPDMMDKKEEAEGEDEVQHHGPHVSIIIMREVAKSAQSEPKRPKSPPTPKASPKSK